MINLSSLEPGHVSIDDIVFKIGPRINAAGRMETGRLAVELLTSRSLSEAMQIGEKSTKATTNARILTGKSLRKLWIWCRPGIVSATAAP